jgi:hypothetical protein
MVAQMRSLWTGETAQRNRAMAGSIAAVVIGVLLIVVGAIAHWGWTRVVGATLIVVGGSVLGALIGLGVPHRERVRAGIIAQRTLIAVVAAVFLALPVIAALVAAVIGLFARSGGRGAAALAGGTVIALFLLIASLFGVAIAIRAVQRATFTRTERPQTGEGM